MIYWNWNPIDPVGILGTELASSGIRLEDPIVTSYDHSCHGPTGGPFVVGGFLNASELDSLED